MHAPLHFTQTGAAASASSTNFSLIGGGILSLPLEPQPAHNTDLTDRSSAKANSVSCYFYNITHFPHYFPAHKHTTLESLSLVFFRARIHTSITTTDTAAGWLQQFILHANPLTPCVSSAIAHQPTTDLLYPTETEIYMGLRFIHTALEEMDRIFFSDVSLYSTVEFRLSGNVEFFSFRSMYSKSVENVVQTSPNT